MEDIYRCNNKSIENIPAKFSNLTFYIAMTGQGVTNALLFQIHFVVPRTCSGSKVQTHNFL